MARHFNLQEKDLNRGKGGRSASMARQMALYVARKYTDYSLTEIGRQLAKMPVDPRIGRMLVAAREFDCLAEMVILALGGEFVPFAVNVSATEASETVRPYLPLAERLGEIFLGLSESLPPVIEVEYQGGLADYDTRILTLAVLKGLLSPVSDEPVSYVNAPQLATDRGIEVDPVCEDLYRRAMAIEASLDRRAAALARYRQLEATLDEHLGVEPDPETKNLAHQLARVKSGAV